MSDQPHFWLTTIPVPVWFVALLLVLLLAWNFVINAQIKNFRELFRLYWKAQYDEDMPDV